MSTQVKYHNSSLSFLMDEVKAKEYKIKLKFNAVQIISSVERIAGKNVVKLNLTDYDNITLFLN